MLEPHDAPLYPLWGVTSADLWLKPGCSVLTDRCGFSYIFPSLSLVIFNCIFQSSLQHNWVLQLTPLGFFSCSSSFRPISWSTTPASMETSAMTSDSRVWCSLDILPSGLGTLSTSWSSGGSLASTLLSLQVNGFLFSPLGWRYTGLYYREKSINVTQQPCTPVTSALEKLRQEDQIPGQPASENKQE